MFGNWLDPVYLFNRNLGPFTSNWAYVGLLALVLALVVTGFLKRTALKTGDIFSKKAARRLFSAVWVMGWIGIILWLLRQINVAYFSMPALFLPWLAITLVWLAVIAKYWFKVVPQRRSQLSNEVVKKQYLPR